MSHTAKKRIGEMNAEVILELEEAVAGQEHTAKVSETEPVQTEEIVPALSLWNSE